MCNLSRESNHVVLDFSGLINTYLGSLGFQPFFIISSSLLSIATNSRSFITLEILIPFSVQGTQLLSVRISTFCFNKLECPTFNEVFLTCSLALNSCFSFFIGSFILGNCRLSIFSLSRNLANTSFLLIDLSFLV